jgi:hypothetical protein
VLLSGFLAESRMISPEMVHEAAEEIAGETLMPACDRA